MIPNRTPSRSISGLVGGIAAIAVAVTAFSMGGGPANAQVAARVLP